MCAFHGLILLLISLGYEMLLWIRRHFIGRVFSWILDRQEADRQRGLLPFF